MTDLDRKPAVSDEPEEARSIVIVREYDAPRELVFEVFTDRNHVGAWWGPYGFSTTTEKMDVRPGGEWRFVMHGPDGTDYQNHIFYKEVIVPERLVYSHGDGAEQPACQFHVTVTFDVVDGGTRVELRMLFPSIAERDATAKFGAVEGGRQTLERLETHVAYAQSRAAGYAPFKIERTFDAAPELVWQAFASSDAFSRWWGPQGWAIDVAEFDFQPGGSFHYRMSRSGADPMWGRMYFRELVAPRRLVFVDTFSDPDGALARAPFAPKYPLELLDVISLVGVDGGTRLMLKAAPRAATMEEHAAFRDMTASMTEGYGKTLDKLADWLAASKASS